MTEPQNSPGDGYDLGHQFLPVIEAKTGRQQWLYYFEHCFKGHFAR